MIAASRRLGYVALGAVVGTVVGLELGDHEIVALVAFVVLAFALLRVSSVIRVGPERRRLVAIIAFAFTIRVLVAVLLRDASLAFGQGGTVTGDDRGYLEVAWGIAQYLHGGRDAICYPPDWCGGTYLFGGFVYFESAVMFVFGRDLLLLDTLNAAFGAGLVVVIADISARLFGARAAVISAVTVALYPGLVLFSSLNLKDPLTALLTAIVLDLLVRFQTRPSWSLLLFALLALDPLHSLRWYVFVVMAPLLPMAVALTPNLRKPLMIRALTPNLSKPLMIRWTVLTAALCFGIVVINSIASGSSPLIANPLAVFEDTRSAMSHGRTGFAATPTPELAGPTTLPTSAVPAIATPQAATAPTVVPTTVATTPPAAALAPVPSPIPSSASGSDSLVLTRTLSYLPRGAAYALFAPFPWDIERTVDALVIPDTLGWYVILVSAISTLIVRRSEWRRYAPLAAFALGMLGVFALVEGNIGTLYRHRAVTVVPIFAALAGPGFLAAIARIRRVRRLAR